MEELLDLIINDESPSQVSDSIKNILFAKSAERVDGYRSDVATSMFDIGDDNDDETDSDNE